MNRIELKAINDKIMDKIESVLDHFGLEYVDYPKRLSLCCPIHGSDNEESLSIFKDGHTARGNWNCWTGGCQDEVITQLDHEGNIVQKPRGNDLFSFIRSMLEIQKKETVNLTEAIRWCAKFVKHDSDVEKYYNKELVSQNEFIRSNKIIKKTEFVEEHRFEREFVRQGITVPAQYYIGRGYSPEILDKYDVGFCGIRGKPMYNRVVVPIYDNNYKFAVAFTGRTINPKCSVCNKHHSLSEMCPDKKGVQFAKWRHSNFNKVRYLYNYWFAREHILKSSTAILVEGPGDVWKLEEAGIHIGVAIFGDSLSTEQLSLLNKAGAMTLIILTDNDKAGIKARKNIVSKCERGYNCICPEITNKDIGETSIEDIQSMLNPILGRI